MINEDSRLISDISLTYATKMEPFAVIFMKKGNLFLFILSFLKNDFALWKFLLVRELIIVAYID